MTIKGFDSDCYNQHDNLIIKTTEEINNDKANIIGLDEDQLKQVPDLDPRIVKAWMKDPFQVKVPGDWDGYKSLLGIGSKAPLRRNTGDLKANMRAGMVWMVRKGFGFSGQPPVDRKGATFDGWKVALNRYGPSKKRPFYGEQILKRYSILKKRIEIANN